jgi:circadian clock protein KaiC
MRYFEAEGRVRRAMSIIKNRGGRHEDTIREFLNGEGGINLGPALHGFQGILTGTSPASAPMRQTRLNWEGRISGSS